jgi:hypothetical protein
VVIERILFRGENLSVDGKPVTWTIGMLVSYSLNILLFWAISLGIPIAITAFIVTPFL